MYIGPRPSQTKPSQTTPCKPNQAKPSQAKPSQTKIQAFKSDLQSGSGNDAVGQSQIQNTNELMRHTTKFLVM